MRYRGALRKRYKDQLKRQLAQAGLRRDSWCSSVKKASRTFEAERHETTKERRRRQSERAAFLPSSSQTFVCSKCGRGCASSIGLSSHQRACRNWPSAFPTIPVCQDEPSSNKAFLCTCFNCCTAYQVMFLIRAIVCVFSSCCVVVDLLLFLLLYHLLLLLLFYSLWETVCGWQEQTN